LARCPTGSKVKTNWQLRILRANHVEIALLWNCENQFPKPMVKSTNERTVSVIDNRFPRTQRHMPTLVVKESISMRREKDRNDPRGIFRNETLGTLNNLRSSKHAGHTN